MDNAQYREKGSDLGFFRMCFYAIEVFFCRKHFYAISRKFFYDAFLCDLVVGAIMVKSKEWSKNRREKKNVSKCANLIKSSFTSIKNTNNKVFFIFLDFFLIFSITTH